MKTKQTNTSRHVYTYIVKSYEQTHFYMLSKICTSTRAKDYLNIYDSHIFLSTVYGLVIYYLEITDKEQQACKF